MHLYTLVIPFPVLQEREEELSMSSIFGSAKATQEADNVIILQDKRLTSVRGKKYVQVRSQGSTLRAVCLPGTSKFDC
jgi:twinkle protein